MSSLFDDNMWTVMDIFIIIFLIGYGIKYYTDPPQMNDGNKGFRMNYLMVNEEVFRYGNRMGGLMCIILGILIAILTAIDYFVFSDTTISLIIGGVEIALIALLYFGLKIVVTRKYGNTTKKNPYKNNKKK